jgi:hypothetical protein
MAFPEASKEKLRSNRLLQPRDFLAMQRGYIDLRLKVREGTALNLRQDLGMALPSTLYRLQPLLSGRNACLEHEE